MSILKDEIKSRNLPTLLSREEMKEIMQREVYGYLPKNDFTYTVSDEKIIEKRFQKGNVELSSVNFTLTNKNGSHTFPLYRLLHKDGKKHPVIICINFAQVPNNYFPIEEVSEKDCDIFTFCYNDVTTDDGDFTTGIAPLIFPNGRNSDTDCGKIGLWSFANMRVLDYVLTLDCTDEKNVAVLGHSRLGKTSLYTAMMDERFAFSFSNNAGCMGDALCRGNSGIGRENEDWRSGNPTFGETIPIIYNAFPYWFCPAFEKHSNKYYGDNFDQHYLVASIAPRNVCVCAAELDFWADQKSEQLCCLAASEQWEKMGLAGMQECDHYLQPCEKLLEGNVGFFVNPTMHFLSRHSWNNFIEFMLMHKNK